MLNQDGIPQEGALLYSGPGAAYEEIGKAAPEKAEIREKAKNGKWLRIKPQKGLFAYVSSAYLEIREPETAGRLPVKTVAKQPPEPAPIEDSGSSVAAEGVVKRIGEKQAPATHALIVKVNDEEFVAAYLTAPELNLALWEKAAGQSERNTVLGSRMAPPADHRGENHSRVAEVKHGSDALPRAAGDGRGV